ncbi:MAG: ThiF family adenylyltransferase [Flavobacteriales bacterium]|nr:ThiF family adenylyltransferase [Flavobacteriales bacterium]
MTFSDLFQNSELILKEHILFYNSKAVGILIPGIIFGEANDGSIYVHGLNGVSKLLIDTTENLFLSLVASNSILAGNLNSCKKVNTFLKNQRYSRTMSYVVCIANNCNHALEIITSIKNKRVVFVGCGGIGSLCAIILAGIGIKNIEVIDHDIVEKSNLNRQILWSLNDVDKHKVDVLKDFIKNRFPEINIKTHNKEISPNSIEQFVKKADVVLFTADNPIGMINHAYDFSKKYNFKLISTGYLLNMAGIEIWSKEKQKISWHRSPNPIIPSFGPTNMELAGIASSIIFHFLAGFIKDDSDAYLSWNTSKYPREFLNRINASDFI